MVPSDWVAAPIILVALKKKLQFFSLFSLFGSVSFSLLELLNYKVWSSSFSFLKKFLYFLKQFLSQLQLLVTTHELDYFRSQLKKVIVK